MRSHMYIVGRAYLRAACCNGRLMDGGSGVILPRLLRFRNLYVGG